MSEHGSEMDKKLQDTDQVSLFIAIDKNKGKRNVCLFLGIIMTAVILFFSWSKWLLLLPAISGVGAFLYHMNIAIVSSELRRRANEI